MSDRNTSPAFAVGGDTERRTLSRPYGYELTDADWENLFGDGWRDVKAEVKSKPLPEFPQNFDVTEILEP